MRRFFLLSLLISVVMQIAGQLNKTVLIEYDESDFCITSEDGSLCISSSSLDVGYNSDSTAFALPCVYANILVEPDVEYNSHTVSSTETLLRSNVTIAPYETPIPTNIPITGTVPFNSNRNNNAGYSNGNFAEYIGTSTIGGFKYLRFKVYPFKYLQDTKELYLKNKLVINLSLTANRQKKYSFTSKHLRESVRKMVVNQKELDDLYPVEGMTGKSKMRSTSGYLYDYLIVTCDSLKDEFQKLAEWKTRKGVRTKILTVEDIDTAFVGTSQQIKIKQAIKDYYDNSGYALQYVLLAGDNEIVPTLKSRFTRLIKKTINDSIVYVTEHPNVATDMFYACFGNMDWDVNGDNVIEGEVDGIDYSPEIIVTRLSVNSITDANYQVGKIINYEQNPDTSNWSNNILLCGVTLDDKLYGDDRLSNTHIKCEQFFYPNYIRDYWTGHNKYMFYDTGTSFEGGRAYQFRTENLQEQISRGYTFLFLESHGEPNSWKMEWRPEAPNPGQLYFASDALNSTNTGYTVITTSACLTNAFDSVTTSLSEAFMRNTNARILGYYGSTHYGWYSSSLNYENPTSAFVGKFYKSLFTDARHQIGRAVYDSKRFYTSDKWHLTSMNALCDPEMPVFINTPAVFGNVGITLNNGNLTITTGEQGCRICVSSYDDCGNSYYAVTDSINTHTYNIGNTTCCVCITKDGYIPYVAIAGNDVYIQNETFGAQANIIAGNVFSGSDVTASKPMGPVVIQNCNVKMRHTGTVTITKDFEVLNGAELDITNSN